MIQRTVDFRVKLQKRVLVIAVPAMLANFTTVLPNLVDTAFIGQTSDAIALSGIAIGATLSSFVLWGFGFLRMGTAGFTAQAYGAEDALEVRGSFLRAIALAGLFGFLVLLLMVPIAALSIPLYGASEPAADLASRYFHYRMLAAPFDLATYVVLGWLLGVQRVGTALALQVFLNGTNVVLCYLLVIEFRLGVDGAAIATAIAQFITAIVGVYIVWRLIRLISVPEQRQSTFDVEKLFALGAVNFDIFIRTLALMFVLTFFVSIGARLGDTILAANHILFGFLSTVAQVLDGFAQSAETLTGQAIGARDRNRLRWAIHSSFAWAAITAGILAALIFIFGEMLVSFFSIDLAVRDTAADYLPWLAAAPLVAVWCYLLDGIFIGATRGREMRNSMVLAAGGAILVQFVLVAAFGNHGLWASLMIFFVLRAGLLGRWYPSILRTLES
jgi:multidrug resistance protein, MATE family